jgi:hypothetical protein
MAALLALFAREDELKAEWAQYQPYVDAELTAEFIVYYPKGAGGGHRFGELDLLAATHGKTNRHLAQGRAFLERRRLQ